MKKTVELLAPGGDVDSIKAAIAAGADAVYCGLNKFNARNRAENIDFEDLQGILRLAHGHHCQVFLTLNIIIVESELPDLMRYLNRIVNTGIDGIIIQDLGLFYLLSRYYKGLKIHASTQLNTHNEGQISFLSKLGATRANLARELNMSEIRDLTSSAHQKNLLTEVFVHGSYCISFSGLCYMSSLHGGKSGNRGKCSQPCRDQYVKTPQGKDFPLNLKDNSAWFDLEELSEAGVDSLKIEGRIKGFDYVYAVVKSWRKQLDTFYKEERLHDDNSDLYRVFNRDFSDAYLKGDINKAMFIDNPRDFSIAQLAHIDSTEGKKGYYEEKERLSGEAVSKISQLSIDKAPLTLSVSGATGGPLKISVKTPDASFEVLSGVNLTKERSGKEASKKKKTADRGLDEESLTERLRVLNETEYYMEHLESEGLEGDLFIPFKEFTSLKKRILFTLNGSREYVDPIGVPAIKNAAMEKVKPFLCLLISSPEDITLCDETDGPVYFQLPDSFKNEVARWSELFLNNRRLIPWFPAVLIGEDYKAALELLRQVKPDMIVTNNTGIAYEACERGIPWIAGPCLNLVNSFSLLCLKENFNCSGAFISNELKEYQIKVIKKPDNFKLYYSIYHPLVLMTSRQCFFHQVTGCEKEGIDETCIQGCNKWAPLTNLKGIPFVIEKREGNYNSIYNGSNFLNTDIVTDIPHMFSGFLIDLRDVRTRTQITLDKPGVIRRFQKLLRGEPGAKEELEGIIHPTTKAQYLKGI